MSVTIERAESALNEVRLASVESYIGVRLPDEYRQFLLRNNGGKPIPSGFRFKKGARTSDSLVDWFLAVYDGEYDNFEAYFKTYKVDQVRLPNNLIPIAHDPGGNLVCLSVSGSDVGSVYFWDHEEEGSGVELHLIAKTFNEFLNGLEEL